MTKRENIKTKIDDFLRLILWILGFIALGLLGYRFYRILEPELFRRYW